MSRIIHRLLWFYTTTSRRGKGRDYLEIGDSHFSKQNKNIYLFHFVFSLKLKMIVSTYRTNVSIFIYWTLICHLIHMQPRRSVPTLLAQTLCPAILSRDRMAWSGTERHSGTGGTHLDCTLASNVRPERQFETPNRFPNSTWKLLPLAWFRHIGSKFLWCSSGGCWTSHKRKIAARR